MINNKHEHIVKQVDLLADDILDFTRRLVSEPSVLGNEAGVMNVYKTETSKLGLLPAEVHIDKERLNSVEGFAPVPWDYEGRFNIVAKHDSGFTGGKSLIFNGHLDVVYPGEVQRWDRDPYDPYEKDGWMYGRGSGDMKSGVAAMTYALHAFRQAGFEPCAPVTLEAVIEEECCGNGAVACLDAGYTADAVLIPEPFGAQIYSAQLGVMWFKVLVKGTPVHVLSTQSGSDALEKGYQVIQVLREFEEELNNDNIPEKYKDKNHPINLNIGIMNGGDWPSTVPAFAELHCRISYFPGETYSNMQKRIEFKLKEAEKRLGWDEGSVSLSYYGFRSDGHIADMEWPVIKTLSDVHRSYTGENPAEYISTCTTDLRAFHHFSDCKGTCYGPVADSIHGFNERVDIESVIHTAKIYALFIAEWCGVKE
ncbi:MAG: acetylornithine deacetylase [Denitrovibrio sp.]|nr:MAG: acetylornithine deacetylase [Denitrovibrio sp.]